MAANRRLIQVVPRLLPTRCGVSDHALALASELRQSHGIDSSFVVLGSEASCDLPFPVACCAPSRLIESCVALASGRPAALLVHLSGYGYAADGAPFLLAQALEAVRSHSRFPIAVFFHELFAGGKPWTSAFWHARRQKRAYRSIARLCDLPVTSAGVFARWLESQIVGAAAAPVQCMPVFSLVGEPQPAPDVAQRLGSMAVFGLAATRQRAYRQLPRLRRLLRRLAVDEILDIGPDCGAPAAIHHIPVRPMGILGVQEIGRIFARTAFGFLAYSPNCLAKSGVFAAYAAHGVVPVIADDFALEMDGLRNGVHLLAPQSAMALDPARILLCSAAARCWYSGHRLGDHAAIYARWFQSMASHQILDARRHE